MALNHVRSWLVLVCVVCLTTGCASGAKEIWAHRPWAPIEDTVVNGVKVEAPINRVKRLQELAKNAPEMDAATKEKTCQDLVEQIKTEDDAFMRCVLLHTLGAFPESPLAGEILAAGMKDRDRDARITCCNGWGKRKGPESVKILSEALASDADVDVRLAAARALGALKDPTGVKPLGLALESPDPAMQYRAVLSLHEITGKDFGDNAKAWKEYVDGGSPPEQSLAAKVKNWF